MFKAYSYRISNWNLYVPSTYVYIYLYQKSALSPSRTPINFACQKISLTPFISPLFLKKKHKHTVASPSLSLHPRAHPITSGTLNLASSLQEHHNYKILKANLPLKVHGKKMQRKAEWLLANIDMTHSLHEAAIVADMSAHTLQQVG